MKNFIARISGTKDLTEGKPSKLILNFGLPLLFGLIFQQFYNMVDSVIVGQKLGTDALAAVGSTGSINFMILGFCISATDLQSLLHRLTVRRISRLLRLI